MAIIQTKLAWWQYLLLVYIICWFVWILGRALLPDNFPMETNRWPGIANDLSLIKLMQYAAIALILLIATEERLGYKP